MLQNFSLGTAIYQIIILGLVLLFVISFSLFVRRMLLNSTTKNNQLNEINKKLDKIIELMEEDKK